MTLKELFDKVPVAQHNKIHTIPEAGLVVYEGPAAIYRAYIDSWGQLVPADQASKVALAAL